MKPIEFLEFAEKIFTDGPSGARSATSRSYYSMFHTAREILDENSVLPVDRNHGSVMHVLSRSGIESAMDAHSLLSDLQGDRVKADYRIDNTAFDDSQVAESNIASAREINKCLETFRQLCKDDSEVRKKLEDGYKFLKEKNIIK